MINIDRHLAEDCKDTNPSKQLCQERDRAQERIKTRVPLSSLLSVLIANGLNNMIRK